MSLAAPETERRIAALDACFASWRRPDSPWLRGLADALELYSPEVLRYGVGHGLEAWDAECMRGLLEREAPGAWRGPALTAVWLAGSIPTATFAALALPLLVSSAVVAKPSRHDPVSPALFQRSLCEADPVVGAALEITMDAEPPPEADAVVVYGSDETVRQVQGSLRPGTRFVGYGHKLSAAAIGPDVDLEQAAGAVAIDLCLYDGRGCLSPAHIFVDAGHRDRPSAFAQALGSALSRLAGEQPLGRLDPAEYALVREMRAVAAATDRPLIASSPGLDWAVWQNGVGELGRAGLLRHVGITPTESLAGLSELCSLLHPHLSSLAVSGWKDDPAELVALVQSAGGSRICAPGRLQLPRLDWRHDGMGAVEPLLRSVEFE